MTSSQERRRHARSEQTVGYVPHYAQQRVDKRVIEIMSRRDAAAHQNSRSDQAWPPPAGHIQALPPSAGRVLATHRHERRLSWRVAGSASSRAW